MARGAGDEGRLQTRLKPNRCLGAITHTAALGRLASAPESIRTIRVVELLERTGTAEARNLLQDLQAGGEWSAADVAKLSLERLARRAAAASR